MLYKEQKVFHFWGKKPLKSFILGIICFLLPFLSYFIFIMVTSEVATWLSESDPSV
jgi:hypothetical protein